MGALDASTNADGTSDVGSRATAVRRATSGYAGTTTLDTEDFCIMQFEATTWDDTNQNANVGPMGAGCARAPRASAAHRSPKRR